MYKFFLIAIILGFLINAYLLGVKDKSGSTIESISVIKR